MRETAGKDSGVGDRSVRMEIVVWEGMIVCECGVGTEMRTVCML